MPKRVSENKKKEMIDGFLNGKTINQLSEEFNCTKITIIRHLKNNFDENNYQNLIEKNNKKKSIIDSFEQDNISESVSRNNNIVLEEKSKDIDLITDHSFIEIVPLDYEIENEVQKDLSSVPLSEIDFPKVVYMIVDKNTELEIKLLKDYPQWQFLSQNELNRKTIEIFYDLKIAKSFCKKEQKVLKIPNPDVFNKVAPLLISRGISRIISAEKLIAL